MVHSQSDAASTRVVLTARGLCKRFGDKAVLEGADLDVSAGQVVCISGANGCGKSTLLSALAGVAPADAGSVHISGEKLDGRRGDARRFIGYVPDLHPIGLKLTVKEYLELIGALHHVRGPILQARLSELGVRLAFAEFEDVYVDVCSHGMTKRVALAAALMPDPVVLLLDEPESGLDAQSCDSLRSILLERRDRGLSAVLASHRLEWCRTFWDEHLILKSGTLQREARSIAAAGPSDVSLQDSLQAGD